MAEYEKRVREILKQEQCVFVRHGKGDHDICYSPINGCTFTVPVKIKSRHMANVILKQSGLSHRFR